MPKKYSIEQKEELLRRYAESVSTTDRPISEITRELGVWNITIRSWAKGNQEWMDLYKGSHEERAWKYAEKAHRLIEDAETFYWYEYPTKSGEIHKIKKECNSPLNKAKFWAEALFRYASVLAPEIFGDLRHEIKQIQKELTELRKMVEARNAKK